MNPKNNIPDTNRKDNETSCTCTGSGCHIEAILSVDERGQMVLPKDIREKAGIKPGDKLAVIAWEKNGSVCCLALMKTESLTGMVHQVLKPLLESTGEQK